jgi:poly(ADP-ribose) glycohydrolase ARH3
MVKLRSKFEGTLVGTGIGDALGRPFEGWSRHQIESEIGRVTDLLPDLGSGYGYPAGQYTDDTQLTIAVAESLLRKRGFDPHDLIERLVEWLSEPPIGPGYGCIISIQKLARGESWETAASDSGGNGTAMRVAPIGLFYHNDVLKLIEAARISSIITHNHWAATASAIVVARSVAYLVTHDSLDIDAFLQTLAASVDTSEYKDFSEKILQLKDFLKRDPKEALINLGGMGIEPPWPNPTETREGFISGFAMSTTLASLYCFLLSPDDFQQSVTEAVMSGGDTDSCGAITGAISGSYNGIESIPASWIKKLVKKEYIRQLGSRLFDIVREDSNKDKK